jgi:hypothetical protein
MTSGPFSGVGSTSTTNDGDISRTWRATMYNTDTQDRQFRTFALCAR